MADNIQHMEYPEDPERCQGKSAIGQCCNKGLMMDNGTRSQYCLAHGGSATNDSVNHTAYRNYQLTKFKARLERHATSPAIKNLRDEIGILRMMMEERLNKCTDENDLLMQSAGISDLAIKIEKVVGSCHKLEGSMNQLLDKQAILQFASEIITLIGDEVQDAKVIERITNKMMEIIGRLGNDEGFRETDSE